MSRLRLRVSHRDAALVVAQGATSRSYKPFAQAFGSNAKRNAALVVGAVNHHQHMVKVLQAILRMADLPQNNDVARMRVRLAFISRYCASALKESQIIDEAGRDASFR
jgi:hypothetical protein